MPLPARNLQIETLRQKIAAEIRQAILSQSLRPGERVVERDLAAKLGASLTATREAIIQLESEGLITKRPNASTHITKLTRADVEHIFAVRAVLEEYAFEQAALHATLAQIAEIKRIHNEGVALAQAGKASEYVALDLEFHEAVWHASGNGHLEESLRRTVIPLFGFSMVSLAISDGFNLTQDVRLHAPLLKAIIARDAEGVSKLYRKASQTWKKATLSAFDKEEGAGTRK